jgi:DnaJ like chaperone protein
MRKVTETIDKFFIWLKSAQLGKDLIIRLIVIVIVGGASILLWFISVPILAWYFYKKFGNARIQGCRCHNCNKLNDCNDKFCISCGSPLHTTHYQKTETKSQHTDNTCKCDNCNTANNCNDKFCINCGSPMSKKSTKQNNTNSNRGCTCNQCNTTNDCDDKFCINCGGKLNGISKEFYQAIFNDVDGIIVALLAKIAKVDGRISQEEANYLSIVFDTLSKKRENANQVKEVYKEILKQEKDNLKNIDEFCNKLSHLKVQQEFKIEIIKIFVELAFVDSVYDKNEENIIVKIVHNIGLDFSIYQNIKSEFEPKKEKNGFSQTNMSLDECYITLESTRSDSLETIKKNYRRLVKQYHYDSMASKDLPPDILKFAEDKAKLINGAYEKIKNSRS